MSVFSSADAYWNFAKRVKRTHRYFPDSEATEFFTALVHETEKLKETIPAGSILWRAQLGHGWERLEEEGQYIDDIPGPFPPQRMVPPLDRAREGRANAKGIPCLYLATHKDTALSEVRPGIGSLISVAQFQTLRDLTVVNVTTDERPKHLFGSIPDAEIDRVVLYRIDEAFSEPVTLSDESADYAPTQIIAELFKTKGFDGVGFKSSLGPGHNVALFDITAAKQRNCFLFEANKITFDFLEAGRPYFVSLTK
jgi:hypothetical protein